MFALFLRGGYVECPECGGKTMVIDSREYAGAVYRRRVCKKCDYRFFSEETEIDGRSNKELLRKAMKPARKK